MMIENQNTKMEVEKVEPCVNPERLDQIISDYRLVHDAATNEIDRKRRVVRLKCEERVWMAALWRNYQLEIVKKSFESEIKQIDREHQNEFNSLKEALMQELQEEKKKLQALEEGPSDGYSVDKVGNLIARDSINSGGVSDGITAAMLAAEEQTAAAATSRRLRRREEKASEAASSLPSASAFVASGAGSAAATASASASSRRKQVNNIYTYNTLLQEQDILDDLGAIAKEAGSLGTSRRAAAIIKNTANGASNPTASTPVAPVSSINVSFEKGVLHYNWDIIAVSDRIRIQLSPNSAAVNSTVLACSPSELVVSTASRNQIKVSMNDLETGKVTIFTEDHLLHDS